MLKKMLLDDLAEFEHLTRKGSIKPAHHVMARMIRTMVLMMDTIPNGQIDPSTKENPVTNEEVEALQNPSLDSDQTIAHRVRETLTTEEVEALQIPRETDPVDLVQTLLSDEPKSNDEGQQRMNEAAQALFETPEVQEQLHEHDKPVVLPHDEHGNVVEPLSAEECEAFTKEMNDEDAEIRKMISDGENIESDKEISEETVSDDAEDTKPVRKKRGPNKA